MNKLPIDKIAFDKLASPTGDKKPVVVFTIASREVFDQVIPMLKSFRKFHDWPVLLYTNEEDKAKLDKLPKDIVLRDLTPYLQDPQFYYRATPLLGEGLLDEYELVLKLDSDQLILGDLSYILETKDYDIGTVLNANRSDWQYYGWVELSRVGIAPIEYFNCGFVAMRSKQFVHNWMVNCFSTQFDRMQYKEQDILNIMCYFGNWNVRCFDHHDGVKNYNAWHGLIGKSEWGRAIVRGKAIVVPKGLGDTPYPPSDMEIKVAHLGGGKDAKKDNWAAYFSPEAMERVQEILT